MLFLIKRKKTMLSSVVKYGERWEWQIAGRQLNQMNLMHNIITITRTNLLLVLGKEKIFSEEEDKCNVR